MQNVHYRIVIIVSGAVIVFIDMSSNIQSSLDKKMYSTCINFSTGIIVMNSDTIELSVKLLL